MKNICCLLFYWLLFIFSSKTHAQSSLSHSSIGVQGHYGSFLTRSPKAQFLRDSYTYFGEVYFQQQTDGSRPWHYDNHLPQWGAGIFFGNTGSRQYMGDMAGVFSFINLPLVKRKAFSSKLRTGLGLGWVQHPYDKVHNHKNVMIGSALNAYINFLWQNEFQVAPNTFFNAGFSFSHLSNGGTTLPNLGINATAFSMGVRYGSPVNDRQGMNPVKYNHKAWHYHLYTSVGVKQVPWIGSHRYFINVMNAEVTKNIFPNGRLGGGVTLIYNRSLEVDPYIITPDKRNISKIQVGVFASYEYLFGRFQLPLQLGVHVYNKDTNPYLFQQIGVRYAVTNRLAAQLLLKSNTGKADLLHVGIGYKLK